jgi:nucleoside-triphosphatase THEP1
MPGLRQRQLLPGSQPSRQQQVAFRSLLYGSSKTTSLEKPILDIFIRHISDKRDKKLVHTCTCGASAGGLARMKGPTIIVLSGESGCGKTTLCARVASLARAQGLWVAGVLTPSCLVDGRKVSLDVEDVRTTLRRPLAEACAEPQQSSAGSIGGPATESWRFYADGLAWGTEVLQHATPCDVLIIDELGPLELVRDQGWMIGLDVLRGGRYRLALVAVRPSLLLRFGERLGDIESITVTVTRANRDDLATQIMGLGRANE